MFSANPIISKMSRHRRIEVRTEDYKIFNIFLYIWPRMTNEFGKFTEYV